MFDSRVCSLSSACNDYEGYTTQPYPTIPPRLHNHESSEEEEEPELKDGLQVGEEMHMPMKVIPLDDDETVTTATTITTTTSSSFITGHGILKFEAECYQDSNNKRQHRKSGSGSVHLSHPDHSRTSLSCESINASVIEQQFDQQLQPHPSAMMMPTRQSCQRRNTIQSANHHHHQVCNNKKEEPPIKKKSQKEESSITNRRIQLPQKTAALCSRRIHHDESSSMKDHKGGGQVVVSSQSSWSGGVVLPTETKKLLKGAYDPLQQKLKPPSRNPDHVWIFRLLHWSRNRRLHLWGSSISRQHHHHRLQQWHHHHWWWQQHQCAALASMERGGEKAMERRS